MCWIGFFLGVVSLVLVGCGKSNSNAKTPTSALSADDSDPTVEWTKALRRYALEHRNLPTNFAQLAAAGYVKNSVPAPMGKKFEIEPKTARVVLVNP